MYLEINEKLIANGQGLDLIVTGSELFADIETNYRDYEPWLAIEVNGKLVSRFAPFPGKNRINLLKGKALGKPTRVRLYRELQAMLMEENYVTIKGLEFTGTVEKYENYDLNLEFIGDSITSGEGTYGAREEDDWAAYIMSFSKAYPNLVSARLNADCIVISQGGYGVYSAWDKNKENVIPRIYEKFHRAKWSENSTDAVVINLGTNDKAVLSEEPENIRDAIVSFLETVRRNNKRAHIIWAYGMAGHDLSAIIDEAIRIYTHGSGDRKVSFLELPEVTDETLGSRSHPGPVAHEIAADLICERIIKELNKVN
ncbi:MAG: SGNH/GDSL hydrolase family protein [Lachnospiraceae bacterium]|nr:SGNH/GDSL hydrolase family protein [Lachnospiraceae bacterium]